MDGENLAMKSGLHVIIVDKDEKQANTIARQLMQAKLLQTWQRVSSAEEFTSALDQKPDLIIANYHLSSFNAHQVLSLLRDKESQIPCIVMTNNGDSESAVECLKAGAADYISNIHLFRLPAAVREAIKKEPSGESANAQVGEEPSPAVKQAPKPLEQLEKLAAFGRLAGGVLHDFNNLFTIINGYCELLSLSLKPDDPGQSYVEQILKTCGRGASLSKQLLGFNRHMPIKHTIFDLNTLVAEMAEMLQRILRENIELMVHRPPEPLYIKADAAEIEQIIVNLVVNARDAMPHGGKLLIELKKALLKKSLEIPGINYAHGEYILLTIHDSGVGMSEEVQKRIFTPFFTTKANGTGLGLATVKHYVQRNKGTIQFQSEPNKGTIFRIYFPPSAAPLAQTSTPEMLDILPRGSETIILVEDDQEVRRIIIRLLQMQGYHVLDAQNADEAWLLCKKFPYPIHMLITDMMLPDLTGPELSARLKKVRPHMKVLYISGYGNAAEVMEKMNVQNMQDVLLEKPFTIDTLARRIREILDKK